MSRERILLHCLLLSGIFFLLFPVVRPFFDETTLSGAQQFASERWLVAHSLGIFGFIFLQLGFFGLYLLFRGTRSEKYAFASIVIIIVGAGLTLPFFGAETFSLQVVGRAAVTINDASLIPLINQIRFGPGLLFIFSGLILVIISTIIIAVAAWVSGIMPKWAGIPLAVGFLFFLPLLQGDPSFQWMRIADGFLIMLGCFLLAYLPTKNGKPREHPAAD